MNAIEEVTPKAQWTDGKYGSEVLSLAGGFIKASVSWASVRKDEPSGYQWFCNGFESKKTLLFKDSEAAKASCERFIAKRLQMATDESK